MYSIEIITVTRSSIYLDGLLIHRRPLSPRYIPVMIDISLSLISEPSEISD
jgi:hypothetical protein